MYWLRARYTSPRARVTDARAMPMASLCSSAIAIAPPRVSGRAVETTVVGVPAGGVCAAAGAATARANSGTSARVRRDGRVMSVCVGGISGRGVATVLSLRVRVPRRDGAQEDAGVLIGRALDRPGEHLGNHLPAHRVTERRAHEHRSRGVDIDVLLHEAELLEPAEVAAQLGPCAVRGACC